MVAVAKLGCYSNTRHLLLVGRNEAERAGAARRLAGVVGMIDAILHGHLGEIEGADPVETGDVDGKEILVGSSLMVVPVCS